MHEVVPEHVLRDAISDRMADQLSIRSGVFWARPVLCQRTEDGPNWRLAFDPQKVPPGFTERWERIRHEFEERYDVAEDMPSPAPLPLHLWSRYLPCSYYCMQPLVHAPAAKKSNH